MTVRRIELVCYWDDRGAAKIELDTRGHYIIIPVDDAKLLAAMSNGNYPRVLQELRSALGESSHEHAE